MAATVFRGAFAAQGGIAVEVATLPPRPAGPVKDPQLLQRLAQVAPGCSGWSYSYATGTLVIRPGLRLAPPPPAPPRKVSDASTSTDDLDLGLDDDALTLDLSGADWTSLVGPDLRTFLTVRLSSCAAMETFLVVGTCAERNVAWLWPWSRPDGRRRDTAVPIFAVSVAELQDLPANAMLRQYRLSEIAEAPPTRSAADAEAFVRRARQPLAEPPPPGYFFSRVTDTLMRSDDAVAEWFDVYDDPMVPTLF